MADQPQTGSQTGPQATAGKKKPRGKPFTGADDPRNRQNVVATVPGSEVPEPEDETGDGAPPLLRDLRWAYRNPAVRCRGTGQQEHWRKVLKKNPFKFADLFMKLDREFRQAGGKGKSDPPPVDAIDEGEERVRNLIDELLADTHKELAREDAELAKRPGAAQHAATLQSALKGAVERSEAYQRQCVWLRAKVRKLGGDPWMHESGDPPDPPPNPDLV